MQPSSENQFLAIEQGAHLGANGNNPLPPPTDAQAHAGNYKLGRVDFHGLPVAIENPRHSYRTGINKKTGKRWATRLAAHYGYFSGTTGADGDAVDCFIGPLPNLDTAYIINQFVDGRFDEHKVMLGFIDEEHARRAYQLSFEPGWPGLKSIVPATVDQLKWWLKKGDMRQPLSTYHLPPAGSETMDNLRNVYWTENATPEGMTLDQLLYQIRRSDGSEGLIFDSVSVADILEDAVSVMAFDAMVVPYARLERQMEVLRRVLDRAAPGITTLNVQIIGPFKPRGIATISLAVAAVFELSDGQTISIFFHNPDTTPKRILPTDEVISWKWLLNKKDVTIVVAPERGMDLNIHDVGRRVMMLAGKNSNAFQRANVNRAENMARLKGMKEEAVALEATLSKKQNDLEIEKVEAEDRYMTQTDAAKKRIQALKDEIVTLEKVLSRKKGDLETRKDRNRKKALKKAWVASIKGTFEKLAELGMKRTNSDSDMLWRVEGAQSDFSAVKVDAVENINGIEYSVTTSRSSDTELGLPFKEIGTFNDGESVISFVASEIAKAQKWSDDSRKEAADADDAAAKAEAEAAKAAADAAPQGNITTVKTAKGTKVEVGFNVVEANTLKFSHDSYGNINPDYPKELQPRDRSRETSVAWIKKTAGQLDTDSLGKTRRADTGAPIIGTDGVVESGNGRGLAILDAYLHGNADDYRAWLTEEAASFGLTPGKIKSMKYPILVRVRLTDMNRRQFAIEANQDDKLSMTATEKAKSDADRLTESLISKLSDDGDLLSASNANFIAGFLESLGNTESAQYMTSDGKPTRALIDRVQSAIFSKAYSDDRLLELAADVSKPEVANIISALNVAAPEFVRARIADTASTQTLATKIVDSVEVSLNKQTVDAIIDATNLVRKAKAEGMDVGELVAQRGLFGDIPPATAAMALFISQNNRSPKRLGAAFKAMAEFVRQEADRGSTIDMFGDNQKARLEDIIHAANRKLAKQYGEGAFKIETLDMFIAKPVPPTATSDLQDSKGIPSEVSGGQTQKTADRALFQSVIDATVPDMLSPELGEEILAAYTRNEDDPEITALAEKAMDLYEAALMAAPLPQ